MKNSFKSALTVSLLILASFKGYSQSNEPYIYGELGGGDGTHNIYKMALNAIFMEHQVLSFSYYYSLHRAPGIPADYNPSGLFGPSWPQQTVSMFGLSYGYAFFTNSPLVRFIAKGGVSAGAVSTPVDFTYSSGFFGPNYTYSENKVITMGLMLDPSVEFPLGAGFGFAVGLYTNINPVNSVFGIDASMIFGKTRAKTRHRHIQR